MIQIEVTTNEQQLLADLLTRQIKELHVEIGRTETHDYKKMLKGEKTTLVELLGKIQSNQTTAEYA